MMHESGWLASAFRTSWERQGDKEGRARFLRGLYPDTPTVPLNNLFTNSEPQPPVRRPEVLHGIADQVDDHLRQAESVVRLPNQSAPLKYARRCWGAPLPQAPRGHRPGHLSHEDSVCLSGEMWQNLLGDELHRAQDECWLQTAEVRPEHEMAIIDARLELLNHIDQVAGRAKPEELLLLQVVDEMHEMIVTAGMLMLHITAQRLDSRMHCLCARGSYKGIEDQR